VHGHTKHATQLYSDAAHQRAQLNAHHGPGPPADAERLSALSISHIKSVLYGAFCMGAQEA
jgi:hypothetical protein